MYQEKLEKLEQLKAQIDEEMYAENE